MYNEISDLLASFNGAPGYVLVFASGIGFGYVLRTVKSFPNGGIPVAVVLWCMVWNVLLADVYSPPASLRLWLAKNVLLGFLWGISGWLFHKVLLKRIEDKIPWLRKLNDSDTYKKGQPGWEPQVVDPVQRIQNPPTLPCAPCSPKVDQSSDSAKGGH